MDDALALDNFSEQDVVTLRSMLEYLITNDYADVEEKLTLTQGGFTLHVRLGGQRPGVAAMDRFATTYTKSPQLLMHVLRKLLNSDRQAEATDA